MKTIYYGAKLGGLIQEVSASKVNLESDAVKVFEIDHRDISGEDEVECGRRVAQAGLIAANGAYDEGAVLTVKGYCLIERMATGWNQKNGETPLDINAGNVKTLPSFVAKKFAIEQLIGRTPSQEEMDAILPKPAVPTSDTE